MIKRIALAASLVLALAACQGDNRSTRHLVPIPPATMALMASKGMSQNDPILMRAYKKESEIEVWKRGSDGRYALLKTYPMCRWSGQLGPKTREGDRQAPEGFYTVAPAQMNPNSSFHLSFDLGYPNAYDRAHGRTGAHLMVHGSCSSSGCFAMTDEAISEVYALARESFASGQRSFQFQSYPFRMTAENLAKHRLDPNIAFWRNLKEGSDYFELAKQEPQVSVASGQYAFSGDASVMVAVAQKRQNDDRQVAALAADGVQPIKLVYGDGGQHQSFRQALPGEDGSLAVDAGARNRLGDVSRSRERHRRLPIPLKSCRETAYLLANPSDKLLRQRRQRPCRRPRRQEVTGARCSSASEGCSAGRDPGATGTLHLNAGFAWRVWRPRGTPATKYDTASLGAEGFNDDPAVGASRLCRLDAARALRNRRCLPMDQDSHGTGQNFRMAG